MVAMGGQYKSYQFHPFTIATYLFRPRDLQSLMVIAIPFVKPNPFHPFRVVPRIPGGELAGFKHFLRHGRGSYLELGGRSHPLQGCGMKPSECL